jgi:hypothetical protein
VRPTAPYLATRENDDAEANKESLRSGSQLLLSSWLIIELMSFVALASSVALADPLDDLHKEEENLLVQIGKVEKAETDSRRAWMSRASTEYSAPSEAELPLLRGRLTNVRDPKERVRRQLEEYSVSNRNCVSLACGSHKINNRETSLAPAKAVGAGAVFQL